MDKKDKDKEEHRALRRRVFDAAIATGKIHADTVFDDNWSITCELCNDAAWWPANGFSEAERQQICGPKDLNCPGFGGGEDEQ